MDSQGKRRRVDDRLSNLPDCLLHSILSSLGSRQAVLTSRLSQRWRHLWLHVPCADIDEREFATDKWERFEDFTDHMLTSIPPEMQLDTFRLHLVRGTNGYNNCLAASNRWIRRGLERVPTAVDIRAMGDSTVILRRSFSRGLSMMVSGEAGFTRRLTTLHLVQVRIVVDFLKDLGKDYPVLEVLYMEKCDGYFNVLTSPTLRSLTMIGPSTYGTKDGLLRLIAPRLTSMRLEEFQYNGWRHYYNVEDEAPDPEPLAVLSTASIRLMGLYDNKRERSQWQTRKLEFLKLVCNFMAFLPNVTDLYLSGFTVEASPEKESLKFPVLHNLKTLILEEFGIGTEFPILASILGNTPNLEKLGLHRCIFYGTPSKDRTKERQEAPINLPRVLWCRNLKSIEIKLRTDDDEPRMLKVLSEISERMLSSWWQGVKISSTIL